MKIIRTLGCALFGLAASTALGAPVAGDRILIDLGNSGSSTPGHWNSVGVAANGTLPMSGSAALQKDLIRSSDGASTGAQLFYIGNDGSNRLKSSTNGPGTGSNTTGYPKQAWIDNVFQSRSSTWAEFELRNLDPKLRYDLRFFGHVPANVARPETSFQVDMDGDGIFDLTDGYNPSGNGDSGEADFAEFIDVAPSAKGTIKFRFQSPKATTDHQGIGHWSTLQIDAVEGPAPIAIPAGGVVTGAPGLAVLMGIEETGRALALARQGWLTQMNVIDPATAKELSDQLTDTKGLASAGALRVSQSVPYNDNMVDLLLVDADALDAHAPTDQEILRALVPETGVAQVKRGGQWTELRKGLPQEMDDWTHRDGGPEGNPVSQDRLVGEPKGLQWFSATDTDTDNATGLKTNNGIRLAAGLFYSGYSPESGKVSIDCRSAWNGLIRWRTIVPHVGVSTQETLTAADGKQYYGAASPEGFSMAIDATTGAVAKVYNQGMKLNPPAVGTWAADFKSRWGDRANPRPIFMTQLIDQGVVIQSGGEDPTKVVGLNAETGEKLWEWKAPEGEYVCQLSSGGGRVFAALSNVGARLNMHYRNHSGFTQAVVGLDLRTGQQLWRNDDPNDYLIFNLPYAHDSVYLADSRRDQHANLDGWLGGFGYEEVIRINAATGETIFRVEPVVNRSKRSGIWNNKIGIVGDKVILAFGSEIVEMNALTGGEVRVTADHKDLDQEIGFCSSPLWSPKGQHGSKYHNFVSFDGAPFSYKAITRGGCDETPYLGYGMSFTHGSGCGCTSFLRGPIALTPRPQPAPIPDQLRLLRGEAFGTPLAKKDSKGSWSTLLGSDQRNGFAKTKLRGNLTKRFEIRVPVSAPLSPISKEWPIQADVLGELSPPVVAEGVLLVSVTQRQEVRAYDALTGEPKWTIRTPARVDSPPTIYGGMAFFGCRDGTINAVRLSDGESVWSFLAAPTDRRIVNTGQVESVWPVHGSVLIFKDRLYALAGRHTQTDEGIRLWCLNPETGAILGQTTIDGFRWNSSDPVGPAAADAQGRLVDVLVANFSRTSLAMGTVVINPETLNWTIEAYGDDDPAESADSDLQPEAPGGMAHIYNFATGTIHRRNHTLGSKGASGYFYDSVGRALFAGRGGPRMAYNGSTLYYVNDSGQLKAAPVDKTTGRPTQGTKNNADKAVAGGRSNAIVLGLAEDAAVCGDSTFLNVVSLEGGTRWLAVDLRSEPQSGEWGALVNHGIAIAEGRLYVATNSGKIMMFQSDLLADNFSAIYPDLDPNGDANKDGISNYLAYALGYDPTETITEPVSPVIKASSDKPIIGYRRRAQVTDVHPCVFGSIDLKSWNLLEQDRDYVIESASSQGNDISVKLTNPPTTGPYFVKVVYHKQSPSAL